MNIKQEVLNDVVIKFAGDSGDGMQLTGNQFTNNTAMLGIDLATFPDFPAEIRALGVGFPYAITVAVFGGSAEYVALWLKNKGHESLFYWYITICIFISLLVYLLMSDTKKTSTLNEDICEEVG